MGTDNSTSVAKAQTEGLAEQPRCFATLPKEMRMRHMLERMDTLFWIHRAFLFTCYAALKCREQANEDVATILDDHIANRFDEQAQELKDFLSEIDGEAALTEIPA